MPTIQDDVATSVRLTVARKLGVSLAAVSYAVNGKPGVSPLLRRKILAAIERERARSSNNSPALKNAAISRLTQGVVARTIGVSRELVSRALNGHPDISPQTRQRILSALDEFGYQSNHLANSLRRGRTYTIGLLVNHTTLTWREPVFSMIISGAIARAAELGFVAAVYYYDEYRDGRDFARMLNDGRSDGGIVVDNPVLSEDELRRIEQSRLPLVLVNSWVPERAVCTVCSDDYHGSRALTEHLISLGHRRIVSVHARKSALLERRRGHRDALRRAGIKLPPEYELWEEAGEDLAARMKQLLEHPEKRPTAIRANFDTDALKWVRLLASWGFRVPQDVAVAGYDDFPFAALVRPSLTTVHTDYYQMGRIAAEILIARLHGDAEIRHRVVPTKLIVRESTAPWSADGASRGTVS